VLAGFALDTFGSAATLIGARAAIVVSTAAVLFVREVRELRATVPATSD
jgi:hypothetical protein